MFTVTFLDYGCPDFGGQEYYEDEKLFSNWQQAQEFINSLEDYEFKAAAYHFSCNACYGLFCFEDEIPF